jgi:IMP dehydrogenase/GMP reductase
VSNFTEADDLLAGKTFDDLLLYPRFGRVESRKTVDTSLVLVKGFSLQVPVMSAPMATVTDHVTCRRMAEGGGVGILPRNRFVAGHGSGIAVACDDMGRVEYLVKQGVTFIVVDIAHGHSEVMRQALTRYRAAFPDLIIGAGNVATAQGTIDLRNWGADFVKVGIGPGRACLTRLKTGFGVAQAQAIYECARTGVPIVADGGIRHEKDIFMALALGARAVVLGSMLAGAPEAPGRGRYTGVTAYDRCRPPEGTTMVVPQTRPIVDIMRDIKGYLQSSVSYSGYTSLVEARARIMEYPQGHFQVISEATRRESYER